MLNFGRGEQEDNFVDDGFYVHHGIPLLYGGEPDEDALTPLPLLRFDVAAVQQPVTMGLPPLYHLPLLPPSHYRLPAPVADDIDMEAVAAGIVIDAPVSAPRTAPVPLPPTAVTPIPADVEDEEEQAELIGLSAAESLSDRFDPLYPYLLYLALAIGTIFYGGIQPLTRYTILWTVLIGLGTFFTLVDAAEDAPPRRMAPANVGWGFSIGLVFALPLFILIGASLADIVRQIFPEVAPAAMFQSLAIVGPLGESLFFRGGLQERRGFGTAVLAATVSGIVFFLPATISQPIYLIAISIFMMVLSGVYSFIRIQYGLTAATICQITVNLLLLFAPAVFIL